MSAEPPKPVDQAVVVPAKTVRRSAEMLARALNALAILAALAALQWARPLLVPILFGILISYALDPIVETLVHSRLPRAIAATTVFCASLAAVIAIGVALSHQVSTVADRLPSAAQELRAAVQSRWAGRSGPVAKVQQAADELQKLSGAAAPAGSAPARIQTVAIQRKPFDLGEYLWEGSLSVTTFVGDTVVVLFLAFYLLLAGDVFRRRVIEIAGPTLSQKKVTLQILDAIASQISRYLFVRLAISVIVGAGTFIAFWAIGLANPMVWGVAAGLLNVIPYVGPIAVALAAGVAGFLEFHAISHGLLAAGLATTVACLETYAVTPWLMSRTAEMNPAAVFVGLVFWGWLWGLSGLFLAVPLLMVIKAIGEHVEALQPVATLLRR